MSKFIVETMTYRQLVEKINELREAWLTKDGEKKADIRVEPLPTEPIADWLLTIRADPHDKLYRALYAIQSSPAIHQLGMRTERDLGDANARYMLSGYYEAVARCIENVEGVDGVGNELKYASGIRWQKALEADTPEAEQLDDLIGCLVLYYNLKRKVNAGKSDAP